MVNWVIPDYDIRGQFDLAFWPELRFLACYVRFLPNNYVLYHIFAENQEKSVLISKTPHCVPDVCKSFLRKEIKNFEIFYFCF